MDVTGVPLAPRAPGPRVDAAEVAAVVAALWRSAAPTGGEVAPASPAPAPWPGDRTPVLRALVAVEGSSAEDWSGDVVVACGEPAAERWARHLLALGPDDLLDEQDVRDAVGEVANVLAGAVKARCAPEGLLGLPRLTGALEPLGRSDVGGDVTTALRWPEPSAADGDAVTVVALVTR